jgi:hypothetical protein
MLEEQQQRKKITMTRKSSSYQTVISKLIEECTNEPNKDKRIEILNLVNSNLLKSDQLNITLSSHLTNDNIDKVLHILKGRFLIV